MSLILIGHSMGDDDEFSKLLKPNVLEPNQGQEKAFSISPIMLEHDPAEDYFTESSGDYTQEEEKERRKILGFLRDYESKLSGVALW
jgi:hypothetical protein